MPKTVTPEQKQEIIAWYQSHPRYNELMQALAIVEADMVKLMAIRKEMEIDRAKFKENKQCDSKL